MRVHESFDVSGQKQLNTLKKYILMHAAAFEKNRQEMGELFSKEVLERLVETNSFLADAHKHLIQAARVYTECVVALRASNQENASQGEQEELQKQQTDAHNIFIDSFEVFIGIVYEHKESQNIIGYLQKLDGFFDEKEIEIVLPQKEEERLVLNNFSRIRSSQIALFITYDRAKEGCE